MPSLGSIKITVISSWLLMWPQASSVRLTLGGLLDALPTPLSPNWPLLAGTGVG